MIAYRLGELPDIDRLSEQEHIPLGARIGIHAAKSVPLPDGTLFGEASCEQVSEWFSHLFAQAGVSPRLMDDILRGLDLAEWDDRWYALNELLELGSVRDVFEGKIREPKVVRVHQGGLSRADLEELLGEYGLRVALSRKGTGLGSVYGQCNTVGRRCKIYLGTLAALEEGALLRENVIDKLERKSAEWKQNAA